MWGFLIGAAKAAFYIQRTATAVGIAVVITLSVYDILKKRKP